MRENVSFFNIKGTVMGLSYNKIATATIVNVWVENGVGRYNIVLSDTAKGFDLNLLRFGHSVRFKGVAHDFEFINDFGERKVSTHYNALQMIAE